MAKFKYGDLEYESERMARYLHENAVGYAKSQGWNQKDTEGFLNSVNELIGRILSGDADYLNFQGQVHTNSEGFENIPEERKKILGIGIGKKARDYNGRAVYYLDQALRAIPSQPRESFSNKGVYNAWVKKYFGGNTPNDSNLEQIWTSLDAADDNGRRGRVNRLTEFGKFMNEYANSADLDNLNYTGSVHTDANDYRNKLRTAAQFALAGDYDSFLRAYSQSGEDLNLINPLFVDGTSTQSDQSESTVDPLTEYRKQLKDAGYSDEQIENLVAIKQKELENERIKTYNEIMRNENWQNFANEHFINDGNDITLQLDTTPFNFVKWEGERRDDKEVPGLIENLGETKFYEPYRKFIEGTRTGVFNGINKEMLRANLYYRRKFVPGEFIKIENSNNEYFIVPTINLNNGTAWKYNTQTRKLSRVHVDKHNTPHLLKILKSRWESQNPIIDSWKEGGIIKMQDGSTIAGIRRERKAKIDAFYNDEAARTNRTVDLVKAGQANKNSIDDLSTADKVRLASLAQDISSIAASFIPGYGTAASGILGLTSTGTDLYADVIDDSVSAEQAGKNVLMNLGFTALGLIPGGGGKIGKVIKSAKVLLPIALTIPQVNYMMTDPSFAKTIRKIQAYGDDSKMNPGEKSDFTSDDWKNLDVLAKTLVGVSHTGRRIYNTAKLKHVSSGEQKLQVEVIRNGKRDKVPITPDHARQIIAEGLSKGNKAAQEKFNYLGYNGELQSKFKSTTGSKWNPLNWPKKAYSSTYNRFKGLTGTTIDADERVQRINNEYRNRYIAQLNSSGVGKFLGKYLNNDYDIAFNNAPFFKYGSNYGKSPEYKTLEENTAKYKAELEANLNERYKNMLEREYELNDFDLSGNAFTKNWKASRKQLPKYVTMAEKSKIKIDDLDKYLKFFDELRRHNPYYETMLTNPQFMLASKAQYKFKKGGSIPKYQTGTGPQGIYSDASTWNDEVNRLYIPFVLNLLKENKITPDQFNKYLDSHSKSHQEAINTGYNWHERAYRPKDNSVHDQEVLFLNWGLNNVGIGPNEGRRYKVYSSNPYSGDSSAGGWQPDNLYSGKHDDRHFGRRENYDDKTLAAVKELYKKAGYDYFLDDKSGYYHIKKLDDQTSSPGMLSGTQPGNDGNNGNNGNDGNLTNPVIPTEGADEDTPKTLDLSPFLKTYEFLDAYRTNKKMRDLFLKEYTFPTEEYTPKHLNIYGDLAALRKGYNEAANLESSARRMANNSSDMSLANATVLQGNSQANEGRAAARQKFNELVRSTAEKATQQEFENVDNELKVANENKAREVAAHNLRTLNTLEYMNQQHANRKAFIDELILDTKTKRQDKLNLDEQMLQLQAAHALERSPEVKRLYDVYKASGKEEDYNKYLAEKKRQKELISDELYKKMYALRGYRYRDFGFGNSGGYTFTSYKSGGKVSDDGPRKTRSKTLDRFRKSQKDLMDNNNKKLDRLGRLTYLYAKRAQGK